MPHELSCLDRDLIRQTLSVARGHRIGFKLVSDDWDVPGRREYSAHHEANLTPFLESSREGVIRLSFRQGLLMAKTDAISLVAYPLTYIRLGIPHDDAPKSSEVDWPARPRCDYSSEDLRGLENSDAYTLFEGTSLRLRHLSAERLDQSRTDPGLLPETFRIRIPISAESREQAGSLVKRRYASRGYQVTSAKAADPSLFPFVAYNNGDLVGTASLRLDSLRGLAADELYKTEIDSCEVPEFASASSPG